MKAKINKKEEIAEGALLVEFDLLGKNVYFEPGQYFYLTLLNPPYTDEKGNQRHFSIVNSPNEKGVVVMTTRLTDSGFKKSLKEMPPGTEVEIEGVGGSFSLPKDKSRAIVMIAGGIGITPFISMLRYVNEQNIACKITLLYSNRNRKSTAFLQELENLARTNQNFNLILTMTDDPDWQGEKDKIDSSFIKKHISSPNDCTFLIAGPPVMVEAIRKTLSEIGIENKNIKADNFSGY